MLWLAYAEGSSHQEIAGALGIKTASIKLHAVPGAPAAGRAARPTPGKGRCPVKRIDCPFEDDVLMMVTTGRWPDRAPADLVAHAAGCDVCADLAVVAQAIDEASGIDAAHVSEDAARVPGAGTVWWRAQLRARQEAAAAVGRPITVAQAALLAVCGGVAGAVFGATTNWFQQAIHRGREVVSSIASNVHLPALPAESAMPLASYGASIAIIGISLALAVVIVVWAFREE